MAVSMARLQKRSEMNVMAFTVKCYGLFSGWDIGEEIGFKEICVSFLINPSFFFCKPAQCNQNETSIIHSFQFPEILPTDFLKAQQHKTSQ